MKKYLFVLAALALFAGACNKPEKEPEKEPEEKEPEVVDETPAKLFSFQLLARGWKETSLAGTVWCVPTCCPKRRSTKRR